MIENSNILARSLAYFQNQLPSNNLFYLKDDMTKQLLNYPTCCKKCDLKKDKVKCVELNYYLEHYENNKCCAVCHKKINSQDIVIVTYLYTIIRNGKVNKNGNMVRISSDFKFEVQD